MAELEHDALVHLPDAYLWLVPELAELDLPVETRSDCGACVMVAPPGEDPDDPRYFHEDLRCCGYHPSLPNHRLGQILNEGGRPAELVRRRLAAVGGANAHALDPGKERARRYSWGATRGFGRDPDHRCPYWVGGDLACGIWRHREGVCRTWYCRHLDGVRGKALWNALRSVLVWVDDRLSIWLVSRGEAPGEGASADVWAAWYAWCDRTLAAAERSAIEALASPVLAGLRTDLRTAWAKRFEPWPEVVEPAIRRVDPCEGGVRLTGEAMYDPLVVPASIFAFFAQLDGARHWRDALAEAGEPAASEIDENLIRELLLRGALGPPDRPRR